VQVNAQKESEWDARKKSDPKPLRCFLVEPIILPKVNRITKTAQGSGNT
jgi:hypothetical protein